MKLKKVYELLPFFNDLVKNAGIDVDLFSVFIGQFDPNIIRGQGLIYTPNNFKRNTGNSVFTEFSGDITLKIEKKENCDYCYSFIDFLENNNGCCSYVLQGCYKKYYINKFYTSQFKTIFEDNKNIFMSATISGRIAEIKEVI